MLWFCLHFQEGDKNVFFVLQMLSNPRCWGHWQWGWKTWRGRALNESKDTQVRNINILPYHMKFIYICDLLLIIMLAFGKIKKQHGHLDAAWPNSAMAQSLVCRFEVYVYIYTIDMVYYRYLQFLIHICAKVYDYAVIMACGTS